MPKTTRQNQFHLIRFTKSISPMIPAGWSISDSKLDSWCTAANPNPNPKSHRFLVENQSLHPPFNPCISIPNGFHKRNQTFPFITSAVQFVIESTRKVECIRYRQPFPWDTLIRLNYPEITKCALCAVCIDHSTTNYVFLFDLLRIWCYYGQHLTISTHFCPSHTLTMFGHHYYCLESHRTSITIHTNTHTMCAAAIDPRPITFLHFFCISTFVWLMTFSSGPRKSSSMHLHIQTTQRCTMIRWRQMTMVSLHTI